MTQPSLPLAESATRSQSAAILRDLKDGAVLDCMVILERYQCNSGKQRIWDLREAGWNIKGEWVELPNKKRIKRWHLDLTQPFIPRNGKPRKAKSISIEKLKSLAKEIAGNDPTAQLTLERLVGEVEKSS